MSTENLPINLRASSLAWYPDCNRRGAANAFPELIAEAGYELAVSRRNVSAAIGTAVHAGAAHTLKEKKEARQTKVRDVIEVSIEKYKTETADGIDFDNSSPNRNDAEHQIMTLTSVYHEQVAPQIQPVEVEFSLKGKIPDAGFVLNLSGHPDCIEQSTIDDLKTGRSVKGVAAQLGCYKILDAANSRFSERVIDRLIIHWLPRTPVSKTFPGLTTIDLPVDVCVFEAKAAIMAIKNQIQSFLKIKSPMCFPANRNSILCGERYCSAWNSDFCKVSKI